MSPREIVRADPATRRKAILLASGLVLFLGVAAIAGRHVVGSASELSQASPAQAVLLFAAFVLPVVILTVVAGVDATRRSLVILRQRRFPPPGMPVLRDTPVIEGTAARAIGVLGCVLGTALLVTAVLFAFLSWRIASVLWFGCPRALP
jgi:hypothetical protein